MSSEDNFDDQPLPVVNEKDAAKAFNAEHVFERSSAAPATVIPSVASIDEFPDEPEPQTEPMPEPQALLRSNTCSALKALAASFSFTTGKG